MPDERPFGATTPPAAFYRYSPDRKAEHARTLLAGCRGFLHADGYAGFADLYEPEPETGVPRLTEVACWARARRKIYDVHVETGSPAAREALERIARLFTVKARHSRAQSSRAPGRPAAPLPRPILADLKAFLDATVAKISGKSSLAGAIRYATSRWAALTRFVDDGRLEMTNNAAKRAIRPLALGRKNYLFAGSDEGGRRPLSCTRSSRPLASMTSIPRLGSPTSSPASPTIRSAESANCCPGTGPRSSSGQGRLISPARSSHHAY